MKRLGTFALAASLQLASAPGTSAQETQSVSIHGFGGWAAGYSSNDNDFNNTASHDVAVENYYFTLNLLARPVESISIHAQPTWQSNLRGKEVTLDLVYVEWAFAQHFRARAGKIKNPLGIYTEIYKVGTLRPFYLLPAMYRNVPESYSGAGLNYLQETGDWEIEVDILGGQMRFEPAPIDMPVGVDPETGQPIFASFDLDYEGRDVVGGGILIRPPIEGLEIGVSAYRLHLYAGPVGAPLESIGDERTRAILGAVEYVNDNLSIRAEAFAVRGPNDFENGYGEVGYRLGSHWQMALQADFIHQTDPKGVVQALEDHQSIGFGLNYWISPKVVWKASYHRVRYNNLSRPTDAVNLALAGQLDENTHVFILGAHFSF